MADQGAVHRRRRVALPPDDADAARTLGASVSGAGNVVTEEDGFLTLKGLLLALAECVGRDPEPSGGPCIPEVLWDRAERGSFFFGVTSVGWNADGGVTIEVEVR